MPSLRAELDHQFQPLPLDIAADLGQQQHTYYIASIFVTSQALNENLTSWRRGMSSV